MSARPWYREPMLALVIGLPVAAVVAGVATLAIAAGGLADSGDSRVRRVAQTQTSDLAPDRAAAMLGLRAAATLEAGDSVRVHFPAEAPTASLSLVLRHATNPRRDRTVALLPAGNGVFAGRLAAPRAAGAYNAELWPAGGQWRLVGRLDAGRARLALEPALGN